jgi:hypothetical protein
MPTKCFWTSIDPFSSVVHFYVALTVGFYFSEEFLSVYVGNLSPSTSVFDLEKVFQAFGRIKPDGVAIRSRKVLPFIKCFDVYFSSLLPS